MYLLAKGFTDFSCTLQRQFRLNIPFLGIARPQPQLWAIYIFPRSVHIFPLAEKADPSWEYIIRSQTHECGHWDLYPNIPFLGIFVSNFQFQSFNFRHFVFSVYKLRNLAFMRVGVHGMKTAGSVFCSSEKKKTGFFPNLCRFICAWKPLSHSRGTLYNTRQQRQHRQKLIKEAHAYVPFAGTGSRHQLLV